MKAMLSTHRPSRAMNIRYTRPRPPAPLFRLTHRVEEGAPARKGRARLAAVAGALLGIVLALPAPSARGGQGTMRPELAAPAGDPYAYTLPEPGTYQLPPIMEAGDGVVLQSDGRPERLRELMKGRITVLSFIYTRCPDPTACPMATGAMRQLRGFSRKDPAIADDLLLLSMSFDPAFDTPKLMGAFERANRRDEAGAPWNFLTAPTQRELTPILKSYGQVLDRGPKEGRIYHPVRVYLIDREGLVRNIYSFGMLDPRMVMTDIRTLLLEEEHHRLTALQP